MRFPLLSIPEKIGEQTFEILSNIDHSVQGCNKINKSKKKIIIFEN